MYAGNLDIYDQFDGSYGARNSVERIAGKIMGDIRNFFGTVWAGIKYGFGGHAGHPQGDGPFCRQVEDGGATIAKMKAASADLQSRARTMNTVTLDYIQANNAIIEQSDRTRHKLNNAAIQAAHMAIDVVRGR